MANLYNVDSPINREERNNLNLTFQDIQSEIGKVVIKTGQIKDEVEGSLVGLQSQIDTLVVEGDSSPEAAQARVGYDGEIYPTLKTRIDDEVTSLNDKDEKIDLNLLQRGVNVRAFGDIATNDAAPIFNSLINSVGYRGIEVPAGTYYIDTEIVMNGRKFLRGIGDVVFRLRTAEAKIRINGDRNIIDNIRIVADNSSVVPDRAIEVSTGSHVNNFSRIFINGVNRGINFNQNCWIQNLDEITIQNCSVGVYAQHEFNNVLFSRVDASSCERGFVFTTTLGNGGSHGINMVSCRSELNSQYGLEINMVGHVSLQGCYFERNGVRDIHCYNSDVNKTLEVLTLTGCTFLSSENYTRSSINSNARKTVAEGCRFYDYTTAFNNYDVYALYGAYKYDTYCVGNVYTSVTNKYRVPLSVLDYDLDSQAPINRAKYSFRGSNFNVDLSAQIYNVSTASGAITATLPNLTGIPSGTYFNFIRTDTTESNCTLNSPYAGQLIISPDVPSGSENYILSQKQKLITLMKVSDTRWLIMNGGV